MQDKYVADIGDYGKYGLLRKIEKKYKLGVNWYRFPDEVGNDGKFISYLNEEKYRKCDPELFDKLHDLIVQKGRNVSSIESCGIFSDSVLFFSDMLLLDPKVGYKEREQWRKQWHESAVRVLRDCEVIFLDPDNGVQVSSVPIASAGKKNGGKYVAIDELADYYYSGKTVILYNHRGRQKTSDYYKRFKDISNEINCKNVYSMCFHRGTVRDYIFFCQNKHSEFISNICKEMMNSYWKSHFSFIEI